MGKARSFFSRFRQTDDDRRADSIKEWAELQEDATLIIDLESRAVARVAGVVERLRVRPRGQAFEAVVTDGTGSITAVWTGKRTIPGMVIGARVVVEGRFGGDKGRLQVMNPAFEFAPSEH